jgi:CHAD domain-containing protein
MDETKTRTTLGWLQRGRSPASGRQEDVADPRAPEAIGAVLHRRLGELVADLHVRDGETRDRVPDGLHQARVTSRRLRSALVTFRPVLVRQVTEPIRADLRWLALSLGDARDAEVVHARLRRRALAELPAEEHDAVLARIDDVLEAMTRAAQAKVDATLATDRYRSLQASLDRIVAHPPWASSASDPAAEALPPLLQREHRRLHRRAVRAQQVSDHPAAYDEAVHDVRKAAKRVRYAWEIAEPVIGTGQRGAAREVSRLLGERQDIVLTLALLGRLEAGAATDGEPTAPWERLRHLEGEHAAHIAADTLDTLKSGTLGADVAVHEK